MFFNWDRSQECNKPFVFRTKGTRHDPGHIMSVKRSGRKSVCVWGWMSAEGAGFLHRINGRLTSQQYIRILEDSLVPYAWARFGPTEDNPIPFVQDRSPIHKSYVVQDWFQDEGKEFDVMPWPPKGADINAIENVWAEMVRSMNTQHIPNADGLWNAVSNIWDQLNQRQTYWQALVNSMSQRLALIKELNGNWSKY